MSVKYSVKQLHDSNFFQDTCESLLSQKETFYNLKLGIINSINEKKLETSNPLFLAVFQDDKIVGCALRSNIDRPLAVSEMPSEALNSLVDFLLNSNQTLNGVIGEITTAIHFKDLWSFKNKIQYKMNIHLGVYEACEIFLPKIYGSIFQASQNEKELVFDFVKGFLLDCFPQNDNSDENIQKLVERHLKNQSIYLLKNSSDEIVSMAAYTRGSKNSGTVSLVYTPKHIRGKGYASLVTALVSQKILQEKKYSSLFTDLENPTSNSIYQKIGYKMIGENIHFDFLNKI